MTKDEIVSIANFLGEDITDDQINRLMDEVRACSISDREEIKYLLDSISFYTALRENECELGGYSRY